MRNFLHLLLCIISLFFLSCSEKNANQDKNISDNSVPSDFAHANADLIEEKNIDPNIPKKLEKITFVELGSVNCIPCKKMQPVMKSIEAKYGEQINIIFYDVWKPEQKQYAYHYNIRLIPTQVFLDEQGNEIMRHEGFFPESEIDKFLISQGLSSKQK